VAFGSTTVGDVPVVFGASAFAPPPLSTVLLPIVDPAGLGFDWAIAPPVARPSARIDAAISFAFMMLLLLSYRHGVNDRGLSSFPKNTGKKIRAHLKRPYPKASDSTASGLPVIRRRMRG
jgi:hypothetical protein